MRGVITCYVCMILLSMLFIADTIALGAGCAAINAFVLRFLRCILKIACGGG